MTETSKRSSLLGMLVKFVSQTLTSARSCDFDPVVLVAHVLGCSAVNHRTSQSSETSYRVDYPWSHLGLL